MQVKLTWSYSTTPAGQAPTTFIIQHKLSTASTYTTQTTITNFATICTGTSCTYVYPAGVLDNNKSYDFRVGTDCSEGTTNYSTPITKINVLCPTFTPTATSNSISYQFSGATATSVTGYLVELLLASDNSLLEAKPLAAVAATISGTFSGNQIPNDGIPDYTILPSTLYKVRVTVKSSGADKVCTYDISTTNTPACTAVSNLAACICSVDCATAC